MSALGVAVKPGKSTSAKEYIHDVIEEIRTKNPAEPEFHQAAQEVFESLDPGARPASRVSRGAASSSASSSRSA